MNAADLSLDEFCTWLCAHEHEIVGHPTSFYHSPLARWLSESFGHVYGVDGAWFGRAFQEARCWCLLPRWAVLFASWLERVSSLPVTGLEALDVLARVEWVLRSPALCRKVS